MLDLNQLAVESWEIAQKRGEHGLATDMTGILKHASGEIIEALESFKDLCEYCSEEYTEDFANELADVIVCILIAAGSTIGVDIEKAVLRTVEKNRKRAEGIGDKL